MNDHRYILKPYKSPSSRNTCPSCNQRHKFSRYIDKTSGNEIADHVGRCDRENNCGYHFTPKQYFAENLEGSKLKPIEKNQEPIKPVSYLPFELMERSVLNHKKCDLYPFLVALIGEETATWLCTNYFIGTNREGNTAFWQVDIAGKIRQCKIIQYLTDGHRDKTKSILFTGKKILNDQNANLQQCFFGEYLLSFPDNTGKPVAIVESEKTAVIASVHYPKYVWLATGGKYGAKWTEKNVCSVLAGREIVLFPDINAFDGWKAKGLLLQAITGSRVVISDYLERMATDNERKEGLDICDFIVSKGVSAIQCKTVQNCTEVSAHTPLYKGVHFAPIYCTEK